MSLVPKKAWRAGGAGQGGAGGSRAYSAMLQNQEKPRTLSHHDDAEKRKKEKRKGQELKVHYVISEEIRKMKEEDWL